MAREILIAKASFIATLEDGREVGITKGVTRVRAGHELAEKYPEHFQSIDVHFDVEDATREPGKKRGQ